MMARSLPKEDKVIDVEAESSALMQRSAELASLLAGSEPVVDRSPIRAVEEEAARLGKMARAARSYVAIQLAAGLDAGVGVVVGRPPPIRRVKTDARGRDLDPVHGRAVITPALLAYWEHQRDVVGPTTEGAYRRAIEVCPWQPALVASVKGHLGLLGLRGSGKDEGARELHSALRQYELAYSVLRDGAHDAQNIATAARSRIAALEREAANALVGDETTTVTALIASAVSMVTDGPVDAKGFPVGSTA